jgi:hypothetical protein
MRTDAGFLRSRRTLEQKNERDAREAKQPEKAEVMDEREQPRLLLHLAIDQVQRLGSGIAAGLAGEA